MGFEHHSKIVHCSSFFYFLQEDKELGLTTKALLCVPIRDSMRQVIGEDH